eukprot:UN00762
MCLFIIVLQEHGYCKIPLTEYECFELSVEGNLEAMLNPETHTINTEYT